MEEGKYKEHVTYFSSCYHLQDNAVLCNSHTLLEKKDRNIEKFHALKKSHHLV